MTEHINLAKIYSGNCGYAIWAINNSTQDYLKLAYAQALSIKLTQKQISAVALITDRNTAVEITDAQRNVFDQIVVMSDTWSFAQTWQIRNLSPWKRTVVTDADVLFTASIDHWWNWLEQWDVYLTSSIEDHRGQVITNRWHRDLFDRNQLPDIYTAFYYFRDSVASAEFFNTVRSVAEDQHWFADRLGIAKLNKLGDDELFAIAAMIYGEERCTLPGAAFPRFVHMREPLLGLPNNLAWHQQLHSEFLPNGVWIGHYPQTLPLHYIDKNWLTDDRISAMERDHAQLITSNK